MKKGKWFILVSLFIIINIIVTISSFQKLDKQKISSDYVAVFKGESSERVYSTYFYEKKGKKKKYKYINTISTLSGYDSTTWIEKVIKKGSFKNKNEIIEIARKNSAYNYVKYKDNQIYSIEEFKNILNK